MLGCANFFSGRPSSVTAGRNRLLQERDIGSAMPSFGAAPRAFQGRYLLPHPCPRDRSRATKRFRTLQEALLSGDMPFLQGASGSPRRRKCSCMQPEGKPTGVKKGFLG
ncbi:MAG: hypothetical protein EOO14_04690 [Chitinophagaceae bacterium]|nr:MAG: hypothetical protein EOO14_04690 [Chitinophagaceae bacterium]